VALINQQADLILMTGDLVNNRATEVRPHIPACRKSSPGCLFSPVSTTTTTATTLPWNSPAETPTWNAVWNHAKIGWTLLSDLSHHRPRRR
jgi:hypothetical protein